MRIGYARVSTTDQSLDLQIDALIKAGCSTIFKDTASGAKTDRPELLKALQMLRSGDTLVVWKLDRLGRSLQHLITLINELRLREVAFQSLQESMDTATSGGQLIFGIFAALAEFERQLIRERTMAGLAAARARGRNGGRPVKLSEAQLEKAVKLLQDPSYSVKEIAKTFGIGRSTLYRYLEQQKACSRESE